MIKLRKLNSRGVAHHFALVVVVLAIAIFGVYKLVASHADTPKTVDATISGYSCPGSDAYQAEFKDNQGTKHENVCMHKDGLLYQDHAQGSWTRCKSGLYLLDNACYNLYQASPDYKCPAFWTLSGTKCTAPATVNSGGSNGSSLQAHIVTANCNTIEVEAHGGTTSPVPTHMQLSGGPYASPQDFYGNANMKSNTGLSGSTYRYWTTPDAVKSDNKSTTVQLYVNGNLFDTARIPACKQNAPAGTHQYEGHIVSASTNCNTVTVEAHDFGSQAYPLVEVSAQLTGTLLGRSIWGQNITLPLVIAGKSLNGNGHTYASWDMPAAAKNWGSDIKISLDVQMNGKSVDFTGNPQTFTVGRCTLAPEQTIKNGNGSVSGTFAEGEGSVIPNGQDEVNIGVMVPKNVVVSKVVYYENNKVVTTLTKTDAPELYQYHWATKGLKEGTYQFAAAVYDTSGKYQLAKNGNGQTYLDLIYGKATPANSNPSNGSDTGSSNKSGNGSRNGSQQAGGSKSRPVVDTCTGWLATHYAYSPCHKTPLGSRPSVDNTATTDKSGRMRDDFANVPVKDKDFNCGYIKSNYQNIKSCVPFNNKSAIGFTINLKDGSKMAFVTHYK